MKDVIVIGAGAAGIAATRRLHEAGRDVLLLEASDRLGGRAHTVSFPPGPLDLGCGWLHSARRNPWTRIAQVAGVTIDRSPANFRRQWRGLGFPEAEQAAFARASEAFDTAAHAALDGPDRPLADFATDATWRPLLDAISGFVNGADLADVSLHDWAAYEDAASEDNWRLPAGYGTLVTGYAAGLPMRLSTPVRRSVHSGAALRIETDRGTLEARAAIVAVPTPILADEVLTFDPPLPDKHAAAANLPLGLADKVFLEIAGEHPHDAQLLGNPHSRHTAGYRIGQFGRATIEAFFGGSCAEELERAGAGAAEAFAIDEVAALFGSDWRARLSPLMTTRWRRSEWARGSYSHARIGHAGDRAILAAPVNERLFFAGEACHPHDFSTAHGAYETGIAAAAAAEAAFSA